MNLAILMLLPLLLTLTITDNLNMQIEVVVASKDSFPQGCVFKDQLPTKGFLLSSFLKRRKMTNCAEVCKKTVIDRRDVAQQTVKVLISIFKTLKQ